MLVGVFYCVAGSQVIQALGVLARGFFLVSLEVVLDGLRVILEPKIAITDTKCDKIILIFIFFCFFFCCCLVFVELELGLFWYQSGDDFLIFS